MLGSLAQEELGDWPDLAPKVEVFVAALSDTPLPLPTQAMLMQYYERAGEFAKAEDALFAMLELESGNSRLVDFGLAFYERIERQSDASLVTGGLPRAEVKAGLAELRKRGGS